MRNLLMLLAILSAPAMADPATAANAAIDFDQASAMAARARFMSAGLPLPCMGCSAAFEVQKAKLLALQISICETGYPTAPEYTQACISWWRTVLQ